MKKENLERVEESAAPKEMDGRISPYCPECGSEFACNCEEVDGDS